MSTSSRGFVLLYLMLVVSSVTVAIALTASINSAFAGNRVKADQQNADVRMLTMRCAENLLMQVRNNTALATTGTITNGTGSCTYTVSGTSPTKTISITATQYNLIHRLTITTSQVTPVILSTWTESS